VQRNKARAVVALADVVHSVDSLALITQLDELARAQPKTLDIYLQIKLSDEPRKTGLDPRALEDALARAHDAENLRLLGLMTMAPLDAGDAGDAPACFAELAELARSLQELPASRACFAGGRVRLSMGMSGDFEHALAHHSDVVRIGSLLFEGTEGTDDIGGRGTPRDAGRIGA
jgi:uncharacterized pyridoxal phosphate-containing UPF0001 family protein